MKKITICLLLLLSVSFTVCSKGNRSLQQKQVAPQVVEKKSMQDEFDYYIENEDFEGIKNMEGKYFKFEETRKFSNQLLSQRFSICTDINFDTEELYKNAIIVVYTNKTKPNFSVVYTMFIVSPLKKPENYKGADTQICKIQLVKCEPGYNMFAYGACKYDENGKIVLAGPVMSLVKEKIYEDGSRDGPVWNKIITPDYVIEIKSPDDFIVTKGEDSEYFYYYDDEHYIQG